MELCLLDKIKLICLPHAGGSSITYNNWKKNVNNKIEIYSPELPGRGTRYKEKHPEKMDSIVNDIYKHIENHLTNSCYSLFGHSMGALIVYELYKKIKKNKKPLPKAVFISGMVSPTNNINKNIHLYSDEEIIKKIKSLGGTPKSILKEKEFMKLYIPLIKSDYKMLETYHYEETDIKLTEPTFIFTGKYDSISKELIVNWEKQILSKPTYYEFNGGHFFINEDSNNVLNIIENILLSGDV